MTYTDNLLPCDPLKFHVTIFTNTTQHEEEGASTTNSYQYPVSTAYCLPLQRLSCKSFAQNICPIYRIVPPSQTRTPDPSHFHITVNHPSHQPPTAEPTAPIPSLTKASAVDLKQRQPQQQGLPAFEQPSTSTALWHGQSAVTCPV